MLDRELIAEIRSYLDEVMALAMRIGQAEGKRPATGMSSLDTLDEAQAFRLTNLYTACERIFERIAATLNGAPPEGPNWHRVLLDRMALDVPGARPPVISRETHERLDRLRRFRHAMRHLYGGQVSTDELRPLLAGVGLTANLLHRDMSDFLLTMEAIISTVDPPGDA